MWTSVCACLTAPRRVPQPAAAARPHSSHDKTAAAGREKWAFDPESVGQARAARTRRADVARWATDALPAAVEREACGVVFREANGSACVVFAFEGGANVVVDLPETTRGAVYRAVLKHADALLAARAGAPASAAARRGGRGAAGVLRCAFGAGEAAAAAFLAAGVAPRTRRGGPAARRSAAPRWQATALDGSHAQAGRRDAPRPQGATGLPVLRLLDRRRRFVRVTRIT